MKCGMDWWDGWVLDTHCLPWLPVAFGWPNLCVESLGQSTAGNGRHVVGVTTLLAPRTLHRLLVDLRVVHGHDGVGGRLLGGEAAGLQRKIIFKVKY